MKSKRLAADLTQADLAAKIGVSQPTISLWERGEGLPDDKTISALNGILGTYLPRPEVESSTPEFGAWLQEERARRGLSRRELASKARISAVAVYNIESGRTENPRKETRSRLLDALGSRPPDAVIRATEEQAEVAGLGALTGFEPHNDNDRPTDPGVYVFYDISNRPVYVGEGGDIRKRVRDHAEKFWFKEPIVETGSYLRIADEALRKQVEQILIGFLKSNAVINKQNVRR